MKAIRLAAQLCLLSVVTSPAHGEKVNMSPAELKETATHVIVGDLLKIFERKQTDKDWNTTYYVAEVRVNEVEKGSDIVRNQLVYVRYWIRSRADPNRIVISTSGHRGLPKEGETSRIYLSQNAYDGFGTTTDGGFNVIGANGFEKP
jgi:hypothetical protein